jgi:uncharacterized protein (TIGR03492 family)
VLLLSNGHGEDLSGALLGSELRTLGHQVEALPLVGSGHPYRDAGLPLILKTREFSTGGLGYTSLRGRLTELIQGQVLHLLGGVVKLLRVAQRYDLVVVIGDVIPVMAAWLSRRPVVTYLVAYSSHYEGRLRLPWPCGACLSSRRCRAVFSRDQLSADDLSQQLRRPVAFLGNPFMDPVLAPQPPLPSCRHRLGLLPGSRRPELEQNLRRLLGVVELLPEPLLASGALAVDLALVNSLDDRELAAVAQTEGWRLQAGEGAHQESRLVLGQRQIAVQRSRFSAVLQCSDLLLCMAGTAAEQAVGLAKPVLQLSGEGPQFTPEFAEAQRRLLGPTVFCAEGPVGSADTLQATADLALELLERSSTDRVLKDRCHREAMTRLGTVGGAKRIAGAMDDVLRQHLQGDQG